MPHQAEQFVKLMTTMIMGIARDQWKESLSIKRGGSVISPVGDNGGDRHPAARSSPRRIHADLDEIVPHEPPPHELVGTRLDTEDFLRRLPSDTHREVFRLRDDSHSIASIARVLDLDRGTVRRKIADNRAPFANGRAGLMTGEPAHPFPGRLGRRRFQFRGRAKTRRQGPPAEQGSPCRVCRPRPLPG